MADVVSPAVIKKTQDILGKYVKKPQLSEKLLRKPPFRFLHDVINAVIQETGFLEGLYTADEQISDNVKEKNAKIEYLQKLIDTVKMVTKENLKVKPSKIVAGHEPEKTNELLQAIGKALDKKLSSADAVGKIRNGEIIATKNITSPIQKTKSTRSTIKTDSPTRNKTSSKSSTITSKSTTGKNTATNNKSNNITKQSSTDKSSSIREKVKVEQNGTKSKGKHSRESSKGKSNVGKSSEIIVQQQKNETAITANIDAIPPLETPEEIILIKTLNAEKPLSAGIQKDPLGEEIIIEDNSKDNIELNNNNNLSESNLKSPIKNKSTTPSIITKNGSNGEQQKIPQSFSAELVDIIDQEAELRRKEKLEKKSARHKTRRKLSNEDEDSKSKTKNNQIEDNEDMQQLTKNDSTSEINTMIRNKSFILDDKGTPSRPRTSLRPPSVRPASARPGAPRRRDKNIEIILQPEETIKMAGIDIKVNSMNEELDDDGENLIIIEDPTVNQDAMINFGGNNKIGSSQNSNDIDDTAQQGHLVQQILETQKELAKVELGGDGEKDKKTEDWDAATLRQRQSSAKQMDALRDSIQKLTRSVNPLGKLMDFLQEDIDSMQLEMTMWRNAYTSATSDFKKEKGLTQSAIEPLKHQLAQIEASIKEQIEFTNTSRVNILQNEEKIFKLLNEV